MKLYGHSDREASPDEVTINELAEVNLVATPAELRRIAAFLSACADNIETMGANYGHEHLSDRDSSFKLSPHLVVLPPDADGA